MSIRGASNTNPSAGEISRRLGDLARALLTGLEQPTIEGVMIRAWRDVVVTEWRSRLECLDPVARRVANICIAWAEAEHGDAWELCVPHPMAVRTIAHRDLNVPVPVAGGLASTKPIWLLYRNEVERRLHGQLRENDAFEAARRKVDGEPGMLGATDFAKANATCGERGPEDGFICVLPLSHAGPHGWEGPRRPAYAGGDCDCIHCRYWRKTHVVV